MKLFAMIVMSALATGLGAFDFVRADDEWPQFRGPGGQGHSDVAGLPLTWSETEHIKWKTEIPGAGHSSPVISGEQLWITTAITRELTADEQ